MDVAQLADDICVLHVQTQCAVLYLAEVHDLIRQLPHSLGVSGNGVEKMYALCIALGGNDFLQRCRDKGEWCA